MRLEDIEDFYNIYDTFFFNIENNIENLNVIKSLCKEFEDTGIHALTYRAKEDIRELFNNDSSERIINRYFCKIDLLKERSKKIIKNNKLTHIDNVLNYKCFFDSLHDMDWLIHHTKEFRIPDQIIKIDNEFDTLAQEIERRYNVELPIGTEVGKIIIRELKAKELNSKDFEIELKKRINFWKRQLVESLEIMSDPKPTEQLIKYLEIELEEYKLNRFEQGIGPFLKKEEENLFVFLAERWSNTNKNRWGYIYKFLFDNCNVKFTSKIDYEKYVRKNYKTESKFNYEACTREVFFDELNTLKSEYFDS